MASAPSTFPAPALDWLLDAPGSRVLALGRSCVPLMGQLAARGHRLTANDPDPDGVRELVDEAPRALPTVSEASRMPFVPCGFDVVVVNNHLHRLRLERALPEIARVLRPGGHLAVAYTVRDDSVPWVKRLAALLRSVDPDAMSGSYGQGSVAELEASPHFPLVEHQSFRQWVPISRAGLLSMVTSRFADADAAARDHLISGVGDLYESSARAPQPLLLPYRIACWRAFVDHTELTAPLKVPGGGLSISL